MKQAKSNESANEEIVKEIKKELKRLKIETPFKFKIKAHYNYDDFLQYEDEEFIRNVYLGLLKREVDSVGLETHLDLLRSGKMTKKDIVSSLHRCEEGRIANISLSKPPFAAKECYSYRDFMRYEDETFVENVYMGILKREVDSDGLKHYTDLLRSGKADKKEIILALRECEEGRLANVEILEEFQIKDSYNYDDFLKYDGIEFVNNVYLGLLKREADIVGLATHLKLLTSGKASKEEIILALRECKEGRNTNVELIRGDA